MQKQVVIIHGGHALDVHEDFLARLRSKEVTAGSFKLKKDWKHNTQESLGPTFEVFNPRMPNGEWARYEEWEIWFERIVPFLRDDVILVGHSLGGLFLAKYLSENTLPNTIQILALVAAPYEGMNGKHSRNENFYITEELAGVANQAKNVLLYHSTDDSIVPFSDLNEYSERLPKAHVATFKDRGHFNDEVFPELMKAILDVCGSNQPA